MCNASITVDKLNIVIIKADAVLSKTQKYLVI